jgi:hypothetical protein
VLAVLTVPHAASVLTLPMLLAVLTVPHASGLAEAASLRLAEAALLPIDQTHTGKTHLISEKEHPCIGLVVCSTTPSGTAKLGSPTKQARETREISRPLWKYLSHSLHWVLWRRIRRRNACFPYVHGWSWRSSSKGMPCFSSHGTDLDLWWNWVLGVSLWAQGKV